MRVWRICTAVYRDSSFSGKGGLDSAGRWHHKGNRVVYTSQSLSLAQLETWAHEDPLPGPMKSYIRISADIPDELEIHTIPELGLPVGWRAFDPSPLILRDIGTNWLQSLETVVARVPAVLTPGEFNYLLNPLHPNFSRILQGNPEPFRFDPRMWKR